MKRTGRSDRVLPILEKRFLPPFHISKHSTSHHQRSIAFASPSRSCGTFCQDPTSTPFDIYGKQLHRSAGRWTFSRYCLHRHEQSIPTDYPASVMYVRSLIVDICFCELDSGSTRRLELRFVFFQPTLARARSIVRG